LLQIIKTNEIKWPKITRLNFVTKLTEINLNFLKMMGDK
jgi:hypothetical protein